MCAVTRPEADRATDAAQMLERCRSFVTDDVLPRVADWDHEDILPEAALGRLGEIGVPGALVPAEYGGPGLEVAELVDVWRVLAQGWISLTGAVNTTHLGTALLLRYGTDAQRERWLPGIAAGEIWSSFSITEPQAGSDLKKLRTRVRPADDGFVIDGQKRWIAGGISFPLVFMLAREERISRLSCVVLPTTTRHTDTWEVETLDKLGYRGVESAAWRFRHHYAPGAEILGGASGSGHGAHQMLDVLGIGRVNVACRALGIIDRAILCALDEATGREIADGVLGDYTHAAVRIGELKARQHAVESYVRAAARAVDAGTPEAGELASMAKVFASESAVWAVGLASRLAASRSYVESSELARLRRDAPQTEIGEGANDALLLAVGRSAIQAHHTRG